MQVGDLVKYTSNYANKLLCYGIVKELKTVDNKEMALIFWHKNSPFTFSDRRERQSWVLMDALTKISETQTMKHRAHGHKRRNDFAKGDLVQWNHWKYSDEYREDSRGLRRFDTYLASDLGIVMRVYRSTSKARCWTAEVNFLNGCYDYGIPLACLTKTQGQK